MKNVTIPSQFLQELLALCGPEDHELRERVLKSAAPAATQQGMDSARLGMLTAVEDSGEGLRYGLECLVNNGVNTFKIYDEQHEEYLGDCWLEDPLAAIDAALAIQAKQGATK